MRPSRLERFGLALKLARLAAKLTQVELANELDVDPMTVSRWERGAAEPNRWLWKQLVERFPQLAQFSPKSEEPQRSSKTGTDGH